MPARELNFSGTLDALADLEGRQVAVLIQAHDGGAVPLAIMRGLLGAVEMTQDRLGGVASFPLGGGPEGAIPHGPTGFNLRAANFVGAEHGEDYFMFSVQLDSARLQIMLED